MNKEFFFYCLFLSDLLTVNAGTFSLQYDLKDVLKFKMSAYTPKGFKIDWLLMAENDFTFYTFSTINVRLL